MHKSELPILIIILLTAIFALVNTHFHWIPYSSPPVILMLGIALYSLWEHKYGNKA
jgi:hypothetical protein